MKRIFFTSFGLGMILFIIHALVTQPSLQNKQVLSAKIVSPTENSITPTGSSHTLSTKSLLFVPYWTLTHDHINASDYDTLVYFGLTANTQGIDKTDSGYKQLQHFRDVVDQQNEPTLLAIRLTDTNFNTILLKNKSLQLSIAQEAAKIANESQFNGVVLDFEISAVGFDQVAGDITSFETLFANTVKQRGLSMYATIYGDAYARVRPFAIADIAKSMDGIMVMAYDYHKANGNPGPNFPLQDDEYSITSMINDFSHDVPQRKITVIFGMFGYDWQVDDKGRSEGVGQAIIDANIDKKFISQCVFANCQYHRDPSSAETEIAYDDGTAQHHIVWFEDENSVAKKMAFLKTKGINTFAYWAYGYF